MPYPRTASSRSWIHFFVVLSLWLGPALGKADEPKDPPAWLDLGTFVSQIYPIDTIGIAGSPRFIEQLEDGTLFVGTTDGAFIFDGSRWSPVVGINAVYSCLRLRKGELLLGSGGRLIALRRNALNIYEGVLLFQLGNEEDLITALAEEAEGALWASSGLSLFKIQHNKVVLSTKQTSWNDSLVSVGQNVYADLRTSAFRMGQVSPQGTIAELVLQESDAAQFKSDPVANIYQISDTRALVVTASGRNFEFDGKNFTPFAARSAHDTSLPTRFARGLSGQRTLLGLSKNGFAIIGPDGAVQHRVNKTNGLPEDTITGACEDRDGNLWILTPRAVVKFDSRLRFREFSDSQGIFAKNTKSVLRHRGDLYVGAEEGLFRQVASAQRSEDAFAAVPGIQTARALASDGQTLWVGDVDLVAFHQDGTRQHFKTDGVGAILIPKAEKDLILCGSVIGMVVLRKKEGIWVIDEVLPAAGKMIYGMVERVENEFWAQLGSGMVGRYQLKGDRWAVQFYGAEAGLPNRWIDLGVLDGRLLIPFEPDPSYGAGEWDPVAETFKPTQKFTYYHGWIGPHVYHCVFYHQPELTAYIKPNHRIGNLVPRVPPVALAAIQQAARTREECAFSAYVDTSGATWVCFPSGVLRYEGPLDDPLPTQNTLVLRTIENIRTNQPLVGNLSTTRPIELEAGENWLRVKAALLEFKSELNTVFRITLKGYDDDSEGSWLDRSKPRPLTRTWSQESVRELTNIPSGRYELVIEAKDGTGIRFQALSFPLTIRTPWYRTWLALGCYLFAIIALILLWLSVRERLLRRRNAELQTEIERATQALSLRQKSLETSLAETNRLATELQQSNRALAEAGQAQTQFIRTLGHELRNSIMGITWATRSLEATTEGRNLEQWLPKIRSCIQYIRTLLDDSLALAQCDSAQIAQKLDRFKPADLIEEVIGYSEGILAEKGMVIVKNLDPKCHVLHLGVSTHLKQILLNYVTNAVKYAGRGTITLSVVLPAGEDTGGIHRFRFSVEDEGPGVSPKLESTLFQPFVREMFRDSGNQTEGTGLGLVICKRLAMISGGSVSYSRRTPQGSCFSVEFPLIVHPETNTLPAGSSFPDFSSVRVIALDDDTTQLSTLCCCLEEFQISCVATHSREECMELTRTRPADLYLLDYHLGDYTGLDVALEIQTHFASLGRRPQIHILSGFPMEFLKERVADGTLAGVHAKPISLTAIYQIITQCSPGTKRGTGP